MQKNKYIALFARFLKENGMFNSKKFFSFYEEIIENNGILPHMYLYTYDSFKYGNKNFTLLIKDELINDIINIMHNELSLLTPKNFGFDTFYNYFNEGINEGTLFRKIGKITNALNLNYFKYIKNICIQINNKNHEI